MVSGVNRRGQSVPYGYPTPFATFTTDFDCEVQRRLEHVLSTPSHLGADSLENGRHWLTPSQGGGTTDLTPEKSRQASREDYLRESVRPVVNRLTRGVLPSRWTKNVR